MNDNDGDNVIDFMAAVKNPPNEFALELLEQVIELEMEPQEIVEQLLTLVNALCVAVPELTGPVKRVIEYIGEEL